MADPDGPFCHAAGIPPGGQAAAEIEQALPRLGTLPDAYVLDVLEAARRLASWAEAAQMIAALHLHQRPPRDERGRLLPHNKTIEELSRSATIEEIAARLRIGSGTASHLVDMGEAVRDRFPQAGALLLAGRIDVPRLLALVRGTALLDDVKARWVAAQIIDKLPDLTAAQARARIARLALRADPDHAEKKRRDAENNAQLAVWRNRDNGTATFALTGSPALWALAAQAHVDVLARKAKAAGDDRPLGVLRVVVAYHLLLGHDPDLLGSLPPEDPDDPDPAPAPGPASQACNRSPKPPHPQPGAAFAARRPSIGSRRVHHR